MADFPNIEPDLEGIALIANNQIYDSVLTGETQTASLSGAKWQCTPTFSNRNGKEARDLRAFIFNQSGVSGRFNYYPASIGNVGTHAGAGVINGADQVGSELITKDWDADQELLFAAGDYLTVNGEMKMVTEDVSVGQDYIEYNAVNYMPSPFDPEGWNSDADGTITNIPLNNPSGSTNLGLVEQSTLGGFILNQTGDTPMTIITGEKFYCGILIKSITNDNGVRLRLEFDDTFFGAFSFNCTDGSIIATEGSASASNYIVTEVDGFYLCECFLESDGGYSELNMQFFLCSDASPTSAPPVGSKSYVQAAFFGKADDWPAKLRANATIPITPPLRTSPADGALIEADNPYFPARLESDDQSTLQVSAPVIYNSTFSIIEAF